MKKIYIIISLVLLNLFSVIQAETLFEVKDALNNKVLDVSTDGLRILNEGDTLMVISPAGVRVNLDNSANKALSRTFAVTTTASKNKGLNRVLEVGTQSTTMREGDIGDRYTDFSPENIFLGLKAGQLTEPGIINGYDVGKENLFIGNYAGLNHTTGMNNIFVGSSSGYITNYGSRNIFMGVNAGYNNKTGSDNVYIGTEAGKGYQSGSVYSNGGNNVFIGIKSGYTIRTGFQNVAMGYWSGYYNQAGNYNVFLGALTGVNNVDGIENVYVGYASGAFNEGSNNVMIGKNGSLDDKNISGSVFIGNNAGSPETTSNKLYIDNSDTATPLIYGDFSTDILKVNGRFGVGVSPSYKIHSEDISTFNDSPAIYGKHNVTNNYGVGVTGEGGYRGVIGNAIATEGTAHGVRGVASGTGTGTRVGVYGYATGGAVNYAGEFYGDVNVTGSVLKSKDEVIIDHPLDPENRYLVHSSIGSNEMANVYNGNVNLDDNGRAVVALPEWFESVNTNFRYQLTSIGAPGPNLYISKKVSGNSFEIAGGTPLSEVSWQITAERKDNYAIKNPIAVEKGKNRNEKGLFLHPSAYDLPEQKGIGFESAKDNNNERR